MAVDRGFVKGETTEQQNALCTRSEISTLESSSSSICESELLPGPSSRGKMNNLGIQIPSRDTEEMSEASEDYSPGSASSPLHIAGGRRRSEESGSNSKLTSDHESKASDRKDRRASTSAVEFAREHIQSFEHNLGRSYFFTSLATSLTFHAKSGNDTKKEDNPSTPQGSVLRQGWLMKRGGVVPAWRKRCGVIYPSSEGPILTYSKDQNASPSKSKLAAHPKAIKLSSSTQVDIVATKKDRDFEFKISTSIDTSQKETIIHAKSAVEMNAWILAIKSAIYDCQTLAFDELSEVRSFWDKAGIHGFLVHYGVRKCSNRNHVQTRVLEVNFAESLIVNTKRGESLTTLRFDQLKDAKILPAELDKGWGYGLEIIWDQHRSWPCYLETEASRDDLLGLLQHILDKTTATISPDELGKRLAQLTLKTGVLDRKNGSHNATIKGRFHVKLHEAFLSFFPEAGPYVRPWFVLPLRGLLPVGLDADRCAITLGRHILVADSTAEAKSWYNAILAASILPKEIIDAEMEKREKIRRTCVRAVLKLRKLLHANVKPDGQGPPADKKIIDIMLRQLWNLVFPNDTDGFTSSADMRWQEIGFQRGGPASDLRSSGLLGLHCLIYFIKHHPQVTTSIMNRIRFGVSEGNMKNYPFAIACINVVATLVEMMGFGDAGSHADGSSIAAPKTFAVLIANEIDKRGDALLMRKSMYGNIGQYDSWDDLAGDSITTVFEDLFCMVFPILDRLFVEMGAGYMEFGQVLVAFRRRLAVIFAMDPPNFSVIQALANEPITETLVAPSIISKGVN
ncbi:hypothetical protein LEN26_000592 [Aphanomyces euteiches]|nr:hypothetical protein LEN26_000592 [Aphanomyces euteiches]KAH9193436.1 hypothetical protein AeNC1_004587 [Aphanomyces euteiches]